MESVRDGWMSRPGVWRWISGTIVEHTEAVHGERAEWVCGNVFKPARPVRQATVRKCSSVRIPQGHGQSNRPQCRFDSSATSFQPWRAAVARSALFLARRFPPAGTRKIRFKCQMRCASWNGLASDTATPSDSAWRQSCHRKMPNRATTGVEAAASTQAASRSPSSRDHPGSSQSTIAAPRTSPGDSGRNRETSAPASRQISASMSNPAGSAASIAIRHPGGSRSVVGGSGSSHASLTLRIRG
ncbi:MAG: hypothetical protein RLY70_2599 [Planctomycetota bacterium]